MSTKPPECWAADPNARAVRIELSPEESLLLPHDQFAFATLQNVGNEQELHLVFATHEVTLRGHCLRRIEAAMQRMELSFLGAASSHQRTLIADGQPVITAITVTETKASESEGDRA